MINRDPFGIPSMYKAATSFVNRNGETVEIRETYSPDYNFELTPAQKRHLDSTDDFSVYDDMDVDIKITRNGEEMTQTIRIPSPAKQWRYWHRRMMEGS